MMSPPAPPIIAPTTIAAPPTTMSATLRPAPRVCSRAAVFVDADFATAGALTPTALAATVGPAVFSERPPTDGACARADVDAAARAIASARWIDLIFTFSVSSASVCRPIPDLGAYGRPKLQVSRQEQQRHQTPRLESGRPS